MINVVSHHLNRSPLVFLVSAYKKWALLCCLVFSIPFSVRLEAAGAAAEPPDERRAWIEQMKSSPRGPFSRIRWFCKDGSVHPPKPYACKDLGGGVQHGEWSADTKALRDDGYYVANIYADLTEELLSKIGAGDPLFAQMLIEQFLINADDGWILRKARYYRGAFQYEDEQAGSRKLLRSLSAKADWINYRFLTLRAATRYLDHGNGSASVQEIRQLSASLSDENPAFKTIRAKIHGRPEASDALEVRNFAGTLSTDDAAPYLKLAELIDQVYAKDLSKAVKKIRASNLPSEIREILESTASELATVKSPRDQFILCSKIMAALRDNIASTASGKQRLALLDFSLDLESAFFTAATEMESSIVELSRHDRIALLATTVDALYGVGLVNKRQQRALLGEIDSITQDVITAQEYKKALGYLSLMPSWGTQNLRLFFGQAMAKLSRLEPKANLFIQDYLRGSPMFFYATLIDGLVRDANQAIGVSNNLFGENVGAGLRSLNPGIAHGVLSVAAGKQTSQLDKQGIYLLPETVSELPPVAGILTEGEGNPLSHVQLLARNLGIPNVGVDQSLLQRLREFENKSVVLAVSPAGSVRLTEASDPWASQFLSAQQQPEKTLIQVDLEKLDLSYKDFATLSELRATDSGRTVGPKAAKLGELKHFYPEAVAEGLAIPFGIFRELLESTQHPSGVSLFDWMASSYQRLATLPEPTKSEQTELFRAELENAIANIEPSTAFVVKLKNKLQSVFGEDGSYGVFVRSDTNVEDLPGFTGAGLNLTVANVVGEDNILKAISRVWASPFTARSFAWRQSLMDKPEHVYPAVLLMLSVDADKSGVLVTQEIDTGSNDWLSVAVNEGVGGAVDGQSAESVRINMLTQQTRLMASATAPLRRQVSLDGGVSKLPVSTKDHVLNESNIKRLIQLAQELPTRFPAIVNSDGRPAPADIEFGFVNDELRLFQIRPFLDSDQAHGNTLLQSLDAPLAENAEKPINLQENPTNP